MRKLLLLTLLVTGCMSGNALGASVFVVSNLSDAGPGSLRQAMADANASPDDNIINFAAGVKGSIDLLSALPDIANDLTINGPGRDVLAISGNPTTQFRVFRVSNGSTVVINGLTIKNGTAPEIFNGKISQAEGGGILNNGSLTINDCRFEGNRAFALNSKGGAISNRDRLTVNRSAFLANRISGGPCPVCSSKGGAIYANGPTDVNESDLSGTINGAVIYSEYAVVLNVVKSNINSNSTSGIISDGGRLRIEYSSISENITTPAISGSVGGIRTSGHTDIIGSTISGNSADFGGVWGSSSTSPLSIIGSTITNNSGTTSGGGVVGTAVTYHGSIVAGNFDNSGSRDISGSVNVASSYNFIGNGGTSIFVDGEQGNIVGSPTQPKDPLLFPLGNYGGRTRSQLPRPVSPVINAGPAGPLVPHDQRQVPRTVGGRQDIGSVEFNLSPQTYIPKAAVGTEYRQVLAAAAPAGKANFDIEVLGTLPPGITLTQDSQTTAILGGTPTMEGTFTFTIIAQNSAGFTVSNQFSLTVGTVGSVAFVPVAGRARAPSGWAHPVVFVNVFDKNRIPIKSHRANPFGYFHFSDIQTGETYTFEAVKKVRPSARATITVKQAITDLDLVFTEP